jgi:CHAT domain-containing protein/tetratricopeptide (TPR) repeat protein
MSRSSRAPIWALFAAFITVVPGDAVVDLAVDCDPPGPANLGIGPVRDPGETRGEVPSPAPVEPLVTEALEVSRSFRAVDKQKAIEKLDQVLARAVEQGDSELEQLCLVRLGDLHRRLGRLQEAVDLYRRAIRIEARKDVTLEARMGLSRALLRRDDFAAGKQEALSALSSSRAIGNPGLEADALITLGIAFYFSRELPEAVATLEHAVTYLESGEEGRSLAEAVLYRAFAESDLSREWKGLKGFEKALRISRDRGERDIETLALLGTGHLFSRLGEKQRALELYYEAAPLVEEGGDPSQATSLYGGMAYLHDELGDFEQAEAFYLRILGLHETMGATTMLAANRLFLGRVYDAAGDPGKALDQFLQARALLELVPDRQFEPLVLGEIAGAQAGMGRDSDARVVYDRAISIARRNGFERDAVDLLNRAGELERKRGNLDEARQRFQEALASSRKVNLPFEESKALFHLAQLDQRDGRLEDALTYAESAIQKADALRSKISSRRLRVSYLASVHELHELRVELLMELDRDHPGAGYLERAFLAADRGRARALLDTVAQGESGVLGPVEPALVDYENRLEERVRAAAAAPLDRCGNGGAASPAELRDLLAELDRVRAVRQSHRAPEVASAEIAGVTEVQEELLGDRTALLAYSLGDEASYLWTVTRAGISARTLPSRDRIESEARRLYALLADRDRRADETAKERAERVQRKDTEYWRAASSLSNMLLGNELAGLDVDRLLVVGEGALNRIPFSALASPGDDGSFEPQPLVTRYEVVRLPSIAIGKALARSREPALPLKKIAVLADPVLDPRDPRLSSTGERNDPPEPLSSPAFRDLSRTVEHLPRLLSTREEAKRILELVPAEQGFAALGFDADLGLVSSGTLAGYEVVHFATHGVLSAEHPELSGVVLSLFDAEGRRKPGYLGLHDLYELDLPVRLVVLSACGTGLGKEMRGEGLIGLVGGFLSSGSHGVIASYWNVQDEATAELMSRFYRHLFTENLAPAAALRRAQSSMWAETRWQSPELWGAFEFQGLAP